MGYATRSTFDPDSDEFREYVEHHRSIPTPPAERAKPGGFGSEWDDLSTPELLRRMTDGLCARLLPGSHRATTKCREFADMSLCAMARIALARQGRTGYTGPGQIAAAALRITGTRAAPESYLTTSDFVDVLLNLARASLTEGYTVAPRTFTSWCRATTLADFRQTWRIALGAGPLLAKVPEHAEYTRGQLPSRAEAIQLETWGKILPFTRQAMVNDDLGVLARIPQLFGHAAATMEGDVVYGVLTSNPAMSDGNALFSTAHANVGTPAAIDLTSLEEARRLMRVQTSPEGAPLNLEPRFLIVGPVKEVEALQLTASVVVPTTLGTAIPIALKSVEVVVDARITGTNWYMACSPLACDTLEYARLSGTDEGPTLEARDGFDIDGVEFKCREDFAAAALDWRGLVWNAGA
jgi:phage major head subunit gpT-like protein